MLFRKDFIIQEKNARSLSLLPAESWEALCSDRATFSVHCGNSCASPSHPHPRGPARAVPEASAGPGCLRHPPAAAGPQAQGRANGLGSQDRASGLSGRKKPPKARGLPSVGCGAHRRRSSWVRPLQPPSALHAASGPPGSCFLSGLPQRAGQLLQPEQYKPGPCTFQLGLQDSSPSEGSRCPPCSLEAQ